MNCKQTIIVAIAVTLIAASFLCPPWITLKFAESGPSHMLLTHSEHRLFNNPPATSDVKPPYIAWRYPIQEGVMITVAAGVLCFFLRTRKTRQDVTTNECPAAAAAF